MYAGSGIRGYGNLVIVKHSNNLLSAYAHNRTILVKEGQNVSQGPGDCGNGRFRCRLGQTAFRNTPAGQAGRPVEVPAQPLESADDAAARSAGQRRSGRCAGRDAGRAAVDGGRRRTARRATARRRCRTAPMPTQRRRAQESAAGRALHRHHPALPEPDRHPAPAHGAEQEVHYRHPGQGRRFRRAPENDRAQPAAGGVDRQALHQPRRGAARPDRGRQHRPDARDRQVRAGARLPFFHLRHLVDPPEHRARHHEPGAHGAPAGAHGARAEPDPARQIPPRSPAPRRQGRQRRRHRQPGRPAGGRSAGHPGAVRARHLARRAARQRSAVAA